jgi:hypothetical protein
VTLTLSQRLAELAARSAATDAAAAAALADLLRDGAASLLPWQPLLTPLPPDPLSLLSQSLPPS